MGRHRRRIPIRNWRVTLGAGVALMVVSGTMLMLAGGATAAGGMSQLELAQTTQQNCQILLARATGTAQRNRAQNCINDQQVIINALTTSPSPSPSASASASPSPSPSASSSPSPTPSTTPPTTPPPGPMANCMGTTPSVIDQARLAVCGYPTLFTTGTPPATVLAAYQGPTTITTAGTVIDGKRIPCGITIDGANVIIRNSLVTGTCFWGVYVGNGSLTISDTEINCVDATGTGLWGPNFVGTRLYIHDCENALEINDNSQIVDSYLVAREATSAGHGDDIQSQDGNNVTIRHNTFAGLNPITSSIITNPTLNNGWLIENNFLTAGAYTLYCPEQGTGFTVRNNRFMPARPQGATQPYDQRLAAYGLTHACNHPGITWTGNYRDDTLTTVGP